MDDDAECGSRNVVEFVARARDRVRMNDRERACDDGVEAIWALSSREGAAACARLWARDDAGGTTQS